MSNTSMLPSSKPATPPARRHPLALMHEHLDDLFGTFFGHGRSEAQLGHFWPNVDVSESNGDVKVKVDLPGMDEKEIETWIADDVLTLRGEKKQEKEEKGEQTYRLERSYGSFQREVSLPVKVSFQPVTKTNFGSPSIARCHCSSKLGPRFTAFGAGSFAPLCQLRPIAPALWLIGAGPGVLGSAFCATPTLICSTSPALFLNSCCGYTSSQLHWSGPSGPIQ